MSPGEAPWGAATHVGMGERSVSALSQQLARATTSTRDPPQHTVQAAAGGQAASSSRCRVRVKLWRLDPTQPTAPLQGVEMVVEDAMLFSEMGCDFSPDGSQLVLCVARAVR